MFKKNGRNFYFIYMCTHSSQKEFQNIYFNICSHNWHLVSIMGHKHVFELIPTEILQRNKTRKLHKFTQMTTSTSLTIKPHVYWIKLKSSFLFLLRVSAEGQYLFCKICAISANLYFCDIIRIICAWSGTNFAQYSATYATSFAQFCKIICAKSKIPQNLRKTQYFVQELHPAS